MNTDLTGNLINNAWTASNTGAGLRISVDLLRSRPIKRLRMINGYSTDTGSNPIQFDYGLRNVLIYVSVFAPTTVYQSGLANNVLLFSGQLPMNNPTNGGANYYNIPMSNTAGADTRFSLIANQNKRENLEKDDISSLISLTIMEVLLCRCGDSR